MGVKFRGREMSHQELGHEVLHDLIKGIEDLVVPEAPPRMEGRRLVVTLLPKGEKEK